MQSASADNLNRVLHIRIHYCIALLRQTRVHCRSTRLHTALYPTYCTASQPLNSELDTGTGCCSETGLPCRHPARPSDPASANAAACVRTLRRSHSTVMLPVPSHQCSRTVCGGMGSTWSHAQPSTCTWFFIAKYRTRFGPVQLPRPASGAPARGHVCVSASTATMPSTVML